MTDRSFCALLCNDSFKDIESFDKILKRYNIMFEFFKKRRVTLQSQELSLIPLRKITEEEKQNAACSLNLLTVSVSQIIDYQDKNILDMEYDAILNNLNLQNINHSEHLLKVFKQILDVITFYRIEDKERQFIEYEYQNRMKNAIWSAVPNFALILSTPNVGAMAVALATQVGVGYMNYRKEKSQAGIDKDKELWQLERSAIEQLNGLRRELFAAAWNIAKEYDFPDEWRLTERQISEYNTILMEPDPIKRFQALDYIKENFQAYPPFWYNFAHAAKEIYDDADKLFGNGDFTKEDIKTQKDSYIKFAIKYYEESDSINQNLLREDIISASCALEQIPLIDDLETKKMLLCKAQKYVGENKDVLQIIALNQIAIKDYTSAQRNLLYLVNCGYNTELNAQVLSKIYSVSGNEKDYVVLKRNLSLTNESMYMCPFDQEVSYTTIVEDLCNRYRQFVQLFCDYYNNGKIKLLTDPYNTLSTQDYLQDSDDHIKKNALECVSKYGWDSDFYITSYTAFLNEILDTFRFSKILNEDDLKSSYREIEREIDLLSQIIEEEKSKLHLTDKTQQRDLVKVLMEKALQNKLAWRPNSFEGIEGVLSKILSAMNQRFENLNKSIDSFESYLKENAVSEEPDSINPIKLYEDGVNYLYEKFGFTYYPIGDMTPNLCSPYVLSPKKKIEYGKRITGVFGTFEKKLKEQNIRIINSTDPEMRLILREASPRNAMLPFEAIHISESEYLLFYENKLAYLQINKMMNICKIANYKDVIIFHQEDYVVIANLTTVQSLSNKILINASVLALGGIVGESMYKGAEYISDKIAKKMEIADVKIGGEQKETLYSLINSIKQQF